MVRVCIFQPRVGGISETFIHAHNTQLPNVGGVVHSAHGIPARNGRPILGQNPVSRVFRKISRTARGAAWNEERERAYARVLRQTRADVALAEYGMTGARLFKVCKDQNIPLVVHFHGHDAAAQDVLESFADAYREMFLVASAIVAVSRAMVERLALLGCPEEKLIYSPYGIDCGSFAGATPGEQPPHFFAVGRFVDKKAPYLTLLAFREVLRDVPEAKLRIVGDGRYLNVCKDIVTGLGIGDAVTFLGAQPHHTVAQEMLNARAFVQHSVTASNGDCEGTPLAILEAGAAGLPVVSTRHAGIPDVVIEGETGLLVDERDVAGMAKHMTMLASEPNLAAKLGHNAEKHVRRYFTMEQSISRLTQVLQAAASGDDISKLALQIRQELPVEVACGEGVS